MSPRNILTVGAMMPRKPKIEFHPTPCQCDACGVKFPQATGTEMFDTSPGPTPRGPWGCICRDCFNLSHGTLGLGIGQRYERQDNGLFLQVEGGSATTSFR